MDLYPHFQDVNVMVFIGFGYLMTFLKKNIFNSLGLTFMVAAMVVEWHMLVNGFFEQAFCKYQFGENECAHVWEKIPLGLHSNYTFSFLLFFFFSSLVLSFLCPPLVKEILIFRYVGG